MRIKIISLLLVLLIALSTNAYATDLPINTGQMRIQKKVQSFKDLRDNNVVKQKLDYSCGAASLATILTYYFGEDISEEKILKLIVSNITEVENGIAKERGYSLLDLKMAAEELGYRAAGFKIKLAHLNKLTGPVIVYVTPGETHHFAVFKGIRGDRVYLADPARGNTRLSISKFAKMWDGTVLAIGNINSDEKIYYHSLKINTTWPVQPELTGIQRLF